jgi:outer membrane receptor protein involved in Fe transport
MKIRPMSLNRFLLLTTILFAPSLAAAQTSSEEPANPPPQEAAPTQAAPPQAEPPASADEDNGEIVVLGRFIPEPMRATSEVATFLTGADLARQGDDNAALALTRLTGLSVVSSRFVYVRGLGDRYSSALLNGSPLPSPEPLRRQVPLDLFPSNILEGATVQKTYSPNYPGEFGGGIIDLRTLRSPNQPFLTLKLGTGGNTESTDKRGLTYRGEDNDWTGFAGSLRDTPEPIADALGSGKKINRDNFTTGELETIGESLVSTPLVVVQSEHFQPDFEGEATGGTSVDLGRFNLGLLGVLGYDSQQRTQRATRDVANPGSSPSTSDVVQSNWDITINGFGSASLGWGENEVTLTGLEVHSTTKRAAQSLGTNLNVKQGEQLLTQETGWYERQLGMLQLSGKHKLGSLDVDWRTAFAQSTRDAPYEHYIVYTTSPNFPDGSYNSNNGGNLTKFSDLTDEVGSAGLDFTYTIPLSAKRDATFAAGLDWSNTVRWFNHYSYSFYETSSTLGMSDADRELLLQNRPDFLFQPDSIRPDGFELQELTNNDESYKGRLTQKAAYVSADVAVLPLVRAAIGVRYEDANEEVHTLNHFGAPAFAPPADVSHSYWLPAATVTWNFADNLQMRMGYSQTIARPQLRELAVSRFDDPDTGRQYGGNPYLEDSKFQNYDARLEYYFGRDQFVTGGVFYKDIDKPVEQVIIPLQPPLTTFVNAPKAALYGAELEFRTTFDMPFDLLPFIDGEKWRFAANYTYTHSEIKSGDELVWIAFANNDIEQQSASVLTPDGSQLQGTPENIANIQFGFESGSTEMNLLVGWVDQRILSRGNFNGVTGTPDVIEDPGVNVDLTFRQDFNVMGSVISLGASARNLLDESHDEFQVAPQAQDGPSVRSEFNTYDRGRSFSISLSAKF